MKLPTPSQEAIAHSQQLLTLIQQEIKTNGPMPFSEYMRKVLYEPELGYYSGPLRKLGATGDFITAPEISPIFAQCIAKQAAQIFSVLGEKNMLEIGAGSGQFACDFLTALPNCQYQILEPSASLRHRQQTLLAQHHPDKSIQWLDQLPQTAFNGIIFANEIIDAMPVTCFDYQNNQVSERCVNMSHETLHWELCTATDLLRERVEALHLTTPYQSEINFWAPAWLRSLDACLKAGCVLLIDYGFAESEYYHPNRHQGTLRCHYQHVAHNDPFWYPGLQDITAHVNFTEIARTAHSLQWDIAGFATQSAFLLPLLSMPAHHTTKEQLLYSQALQQLLFPQHMGEIFKVMALTKQLDIDLIGFSGNNSLHQL